MKTTTISTVLLTIAISLAAAGCGGAAASNDAHAASTPTTTSATPAATPTTTTLERPNQPVDDLVRIDNGRMHLRCVGAGPTTVLLIAGWGVGGDTWGAVEADLVQRSRVCSYARFGTGTSDPPTTTQTFTSQATDLHALLDAAGEPGPFVVLGHSFGGAEAVTFASTYEDEVTGLLLLDASPPTWPATVCSVPAYQAGCAVMHDPTLDPERLDVFGAFDQVATITSLGDLPVTVMTASHREATGLTPDELTRLDQIWAEGVARWAGMSSSSNVVTVEHTGHHIELDQPRLVVEELLTLLPPPVS